VWLTCIGGAWQFFPLDYITFVFIVAYLFLITVNALVSIGVRAIVVPLYRVKARRTTAQALCLSTLILSLAVLTILIQVRVLLLRAHSR